MTSLTVAGAASRASLRRGKFSARFRHILRSTLPGSARWRRSVPLMYVIGKKLYELMYVAGCGICMKQFHRLSRKVQICPRLRFNLPPMYMICKEIYRSSRLLPSGTRMDTWYDRGGIG